MSKRVVALITDDRAIAMVAARALADEFEVRAFESDSVGFVEAVARTEPAGIILRGMLSFGSATDVMALLRQEPRLAHVPVLVISSTDALGEAAILGGASAFVSMPFGAAQLASSARRLFQEKRTLLYVEDSRVLHHMIRQSLEDGGYVVVEAYNGREALELLESGRRVDLILSDVDMPEMDGLSLCRSLKGDERFRRIPFILLTSRDGEDSVKAGFTSGADDYLMKPVVQAELLARIDRFLSRRPTQRSERVLLVTPDAQLSNMLATSLQTHHLACDVALDTTAASSLMASHRYSIAILDVKLTGDDGVKLARAIREDETTRDLSLVMISDSKAVGEQVRIRSVGPQSVLVTPFPPDRLLAEVERILADVRHQRQLAAMRGYLSDGAIEAIERRSEDSGSEPRAETTHQTIFFLDIVGFTTLCESMSPSAVVRFLNGFFDEVVQTLAARGAQIDKFIGDCVMARFDREPQGSQRAVLAALEIIEGLPALRAQLGIDVHVRIGINAGPMVIGDIGSAHHRRDFTVIGDQVNVAARLQTSAGVDEVFISDSVASRLSHEFQLTDVGSLPVKGRKEPVRAYRVQRV